ncbi:MAG: hypothetical protein ACYCWW_05530, partial [Deltaproteobacteria bacterium]
ASEPARPKSQGASDLDALFEAPPSSAGAAAELPFDPPAEPAAKDDPFAAVPDAPDLVRPSEPGEMTRFVIAQAKVDSHRSPKRILLFVLSGVALVGGLLFSLSRLGIELPLVPSLHGNHARVFSGASSDKALREELLGAQRRAEQQRQAAIGAALHAKPAEGPIVHKDAQHVDRLDESSRRQLANLYAKGPHEDVHFSKAAGAAPELDRADAPLTAQQVAATVSHFQSGYAMCIDRELKRNPAFKGGKVRIVTTIMSSGLVRSAELQSDDGALVRRLQSSPLGGCLTDQTKRMVFPNFAGDAFDAEIPLVIGASSM